jgi:ubiquinone/menaquinone biosynthesis C-methylase UbiE
MSRRFAFAILALALSAAVGVAQQAQHKPLHREQDPTQQSFADVERFRALFESSERDGWQKPFEVIRALGVQPGATVADIGAGTGYFARRMARVVGERGTVFAADLEPNMVVELRSSAERDGLGNLIPVLASADDPRLPDGTADLVFICNTWHHIADRVAYARRLKRDLAPGGRVAIVDFYKRNVPVGPPPPHKLTAAEVRAEFEAAGYRLAKRIDELLPYQYVLVFEPTS